MEGATLNKPKFIYKWSNVPIAYAIVNCSAIYTGFLQLQVININARGVKRHQNSLRQVVSRKEFLLFKSIIWHLWDHFYRNFVTKYKSKFKIFYFDSILGLY